jgi:hypothetical protein
VDGRLIAVAAVALALCGAAAHAQASDVRVAYVHGRKLIVLDLQTRTRTVAMTDAPLGPVAWSGDGRLLSDAGVIAGGPALPTTAIEWAPTGEVAAFQTGSGAVDLWTPKRGVQTIIRRSWGARSFAWGPNGALALGRHVETRGLGPKHEEVWIWQDGSLRKVAGPIHYDTTPIVEGFAPDGRVLWWDDEYDSASIAADGLTLRANTTPIAKTLIWRDFVTVCGSHLVLAAGGDRYTTKGKRILEDGRDISNDTTRSWVSPSCNGSEVVASAGRNFWERRFSEEHRSVWELEPDRRRLTEPPAAWTDEDPTVLADGSVLFVRTHETARRRSDGQYYSTLHASLDRYSDGVVTPLAPLTVTAPDSGAWQSNYYGHYGWPQLVAVTT